MKRLLTTQAILVCAHETGIVGLVATQDLVRVESQPLLVQNDPEQRPIMGCPNAGPTIKPCTSTLATRQGYSDLARVEGRPVCLDTVRGLTDGTPPGTVDYKVRHPGQEWIAER